MASLNPSVIAESCSCLALRRAARDIARRYDDALRPLDINNGQFSMLAAIAGLQPAGIQALGDLLGMDRTTVTAALKPLQRRGLIAVAVQEDDQRGRQVRLTRLGDRLLQSAVPLWERAQDQASERLGGQHAAAGLRRQLAALS